MYFVNPRRGTETLNGAGNLQLIWHQCFSNCMEALVPVFFQRTKPSQMGRHVTYMLYIYMKKMQSLSFPFTHVKMVKKVKNHSSWFSIFQQLFQLWTETKLI